MKKLFPRSQARASRGFVPDSRKKFAVRFRFLSEKESVPPRHTASHCADMVRYIGINKITAYAPLCER